jgi:hypothetical protein
VDKVDATMDDVRNQLELTNEISEAISNPAGMGIDVRMISLTQVSRAHPLFLRTARRPRHCRRAGRAGAGGAQQAAGGCRGCSIALARSNCCWYVLPLRLAPSAKCTDETRHALSLRPTSPPFSPSTLASHTTVKTPAQAIEEDEEEAELRELQAQLAM